MSAMDFVLYAMAIFGMAITGPFIVPVAVVLFGIHMYHKKRKEVSVW